MRCPVCGENIEDLAADYCPACGAVITVDDETAAR